MLAFVVGTVAALWLASFYLGENGKFAVQYLSIILHGLPDLDLLLGHAISEKFFPKLYMRIFFGICGIAGLAAGHFKLKNWDLSGDPLTDICFLALLFIGALGISYDTDAEWRVRSLGGIALLACVGSANMWNLWNYLPALPRCSCFCCRRREEDDTTTQWKTKSRSPSSRSASRSRSSSPSSSGGGASELTSDSNSDSDYTREQRGSIRGRRRRRFRLATRVPRPYIDKTSPSLNQLFQTKAFQEWVIANPGRIFVSGYKNDGDVANKQD